MRVAIGSDHAGFALKGDLCSLLDEMRVEYRDFGTFSDEPVDYPDFIAPVARAVAGPWPLTQIHCWLRKRRSFARPGISAQKKPNRRAKGSAPSIRNGAMIQVGIIVENVAGLIS